MTTAKFELKAFHCIGMQCPVSIPSGFMDIISEPLKPMISETLTLPY